ncbi:unnamed protein product [Lymnaea stagnalis]|uniref:YqaJ viral recombinase domain-containing protein n=1 Tax=Lymnaea stagnalis TaxID=6523 RepID=A0AAV2I0M8_LYMST
MQKEHPGLQVEECGLFTDKNNSFLAASPDGVVICCNHCFPSVGLVEIKRPFTRRDLTVKESCENKAFFCAIENNSIRLNRSHHYFCQIQGQSDGRNWQTLGGFCCMDIKRSTCGKRSTRGKNLFCCHILVTYAGQTKAVLS